MDRRVKPVKVSPFIKGMRWSLLACGIAYGKKKLEMYQVYEVAERPKRQEQIKQKYIRLRRESHDRDSKEVYEVGREFEITDFPPGWDDDL